MTKLAAALILALTPAIAATTLDQVLTKMDGAAGAFQTMSADIQRTSHTAVINTDEKDEGNVRVKRAGKNLRMITE